MLKNLNQDAKNTDQNVYQTALIDAADLMKQPLYIQPRYSLSNFGQTLSLNSKVKKILKGLAQWAQHVQMAQYISQIKHGYSAVLLTHFLNLPVFLTFLFSGFRSKNIYLLAHYVQAISNNRLTFWLFRFYIWLGYTFLVFEETDALKQVGFSEEEIKHFIAIPHPVLPRPEYKKNKVSNRKWIGLIGEVRTGKKVDENLTLLLECQKELDFGLLLGAQDISAFPQVSFNHNIKFINTTSESDYFKALAACDVILLNYDKKTYYLRASGVIADAAGTRTYVICPDYPFMQKQILWPAPIGIVLNNHTHLKQAIIQVLTLPDAHNNLAFEQHYDLRSAKNLAGILDEALLHHNRD